MREGLSDEFVIRRLVFAMQSTDAETIRNAIDTLLADSSAALSRLWEASACDFTGPSNYTNVIRAIGDRGGIDLIVELLHHQDHKVRYSVIGALEALNDPRCLPALYDAASDASEIVAWRAERAIAAIQHKQVWTERNGHAVVDLPGLQSRCLTVEDLLEELFHANVQIRGRAARLLSICPEPIADRLFNIPASTKKEVTSELIKLLEVLGDPRGIEYAAAGLRKADHKGLTHTSALRALARIGGEPAAKVLVQLLMNDRAKPTPWIRHEIEKVLREIGPAAVEPLIHAYERKPRIRRSMGELLGEIGHERAVEALMAGFVDPSPAVRASAAAGLLNVGAPAVSPLIKLAECDKSKHRVAAMILLGRIGDPAAFMPLSRLIHSRHMPDRRAAAEALGGLWSANPLDLLMEALRSPDLQLQLKAAEALGRGPGDRVLQPLSAAMRDSKWTVRRSAALAMRCQIISGRVSRNLGTVILQIANVLIPMLNDAQTEVAHEARLALKAAEQLDIASQWLLWHAHEEAKGSGERSLASALAYILRRNRISRIRAMDAVRGEDRGVAYCLSSSRDESPPPPPRVPEYASIKAQPGAPSPQIPVPITDYVQFSLTAPRSVRPDSRLVIDVWAHFEEQWREVLRKSRSSASRPVRLQSLGPIPVSQETVLDVVLRIPDFGTEEDNTLYWTGAVGNARFPVAIPSQASPGAHIGSVGFFVNGQRIARLFFEITVGEGTEDTDDKSIWEERAATAFASYASEDRNRVLDRIQGMLKILPDLDVFLDVISLRSGEDFEQRLTEEIKSRDIFYLFWSGAASRSEWVEKEWRTALREKGIDHINPVPLEPASKAPPPKELARLHFNDWTLAFHRDR